MRRGTLVVLVIMLTFAGLVFYSLTNVEPIQVTQTHLERDGNEVFVEGMLRNTGSKIDSVDLEVHYYDQNGRPIGQDKLALNDLRAGAMREFKSPPHDLMGVATFSIYLNHGRNPYGN